MLPIIVIPFPDDNITVATDSDRSAAEYPTGKIT
jgi:hypothetical protein